MSRFPDDLALPSRSTSTPIRFKHELVTQVYFSIEGETIDGTKITGSDQTGELRMLVIPVSVVLPSVRRCRAGLRVTPSSSSSLLLSASAYLIVWICLDVSQLLAALGSHRPVDLTRPLGSH